MYSQFEVSTVIPVYNAEKYVTRAVESALQFPFVVEILLVEDGSIDNSLNVCKGLATRYADKITIIQHKDSRNLGAGHSRNVGLQNAKGQFVSFLDADDYYLPNRFDKDQSVFSKYPDADAVHNVLGISFENDAVKENFFSKGFQSRTGVSEQVKPEELKDVLLGLHPKIRGYFHLDTFTIKRDKLEKVPLFNTLLRLHQDTDWIFKLAFLLNIYSGELETPVAIRHVHPSNRITKDADYKSRAKMYHEFYVWLKNKNEKSIYKKRIAGLWAHHHLSEHNSKVRRFLIGLKLGLDKNILFSYKNCKIVLKKIIK